MRGDTEGWPRDANCCDRQALGVQNRHGDAAQALLEFLGARWYAAAVASATAASGSPVTATLAVAGHMAEHFRDARRVLNAVTDGYLFPWREQWFGTR